MGHTILVTDEDGKTRYVKETHDSRTKQADAAACDINNVMRKFERTGQLTHINEVLPRYGDFSNVPTYHEALNQINELEREFMSLPPELRHQFNHNPQELVDYLSDPQNLDNVIKLGLAPDPRDGDREDQVEAAPEEASETPPA